MSTISRNRTIKDSQLTPGKFVTVRGKIAYSRLVRPIEGEELIKTDARKAEYGMNPIGKPYTTVTIKNAEIIPMTPGVLTVEEQFVQERFYKKVDDPASPAAIAAACDNYSIINKSPFPNQFYRAAEGKLKEGTQFIPEGELANDLDVLLVLRVFEAKNYGRRKSITLHSIILQEDPRYFVGTNTAALADAGIVLHNTAAAALNADPAHTDAPAADKDIAATEPAVAQTAGDPEGPWVCPACGATVAAGLSFCGTCGARKPSLNNMSGNQYASRPVQGSAIGGIKLNGREY